MLSGFKDFVLRGNVVDLAVAFLLGVAFTALVQSFADNLIQPFINVLAGGRPEGLGFYLNSSNPGTFVDIAAVLTAAINFLVVAAVAYFLVVLPMTRLLERRQRGAEPEPEAVPEDVALLREIRDLLRSSPGSTR